MTQKQLVGVWQRDTKRVGNGLEQNFRFFDNGSFVVNLGNQGDDARGIIALKGRYRLDHNNLYITIISRTIVEGGKISIDDPGVSYSNFSISGGQIKDVPEGNPGELPDPLVITVVALGHIELGAETYYKISKAKLKEIGQ